MKEVLKQSVNFWQSYWGNSLMPWLLLAAVFFLVIFRRKKKSTKYLLFYLFLVLALFFLPTCSQDHTEVYRLQCILACSLASSGGSCYCCGYDRISEGEKGILQFLLVIAAAGAVAVCGKGICQAGNYKLVHKLPACAGCRWLPSARW